MGNAQTDGPISNASQGKTLLTRQIQLNSLSSHALTLQLLLAVVDSSTLNASG